MTVILGNCIIHVRSFSACHSVHEVIRMLEGSICSAIMYVGNDFLSGSLDNFYIHWNRFAVSFVPLSHDTTALFVSIATN
jgi:hypothetical protein